MIRPGGRGQCFVLAMFQRAKMRQSEQYVPRNAQSCPKGKTPFQSGWEDIKGANCCKFKGHLY